MIVQREISIMSDFLTKLFISTEKPALLCKKNQIFDEAHVKETSSNIPDFLYINITWRN